MIHPDFYEKQGFWAALRDFGIWAGVQLVAGFVLLGLILAASRC